MGLRIKTNVESLQAQRAFGENRQNMMDSLQKLSTGRRINKSADDAAGLAVSETMNAKIRSMGTCKKNASDGISYLQVAEGGLSELNNIVVRMRELTTQSASDTIGTTERSFLDREFQELGKEITRITGETEFNGKKVLSTNSDSKEMSVQVGASFRVPGQETESGSDVIKLNFEQVQSFTDALKDLDGLNIQGESGQELGGTSTSEIFSKLDNTMRSVTDFRATLGAMQSRMNSAITAIDVGMENLSSAQSRIRDVDYAAETAKMTQSKILTAAGTSVLAQANSSPEMVMQLLRG